jgi:gliding motility-associated-like protein
MKLILNRFILFWCLFLFALTVQARPKANLVITSYCQNTDTVNISGSTSTYNSGDSIIYQYFLTSNASLPRGTGDSLKGIVFQHIGKDTIKLRIFTFTHGNTTPTDSDSVTVTFTVLYNAHANFTPISRCADSAVTFINNTYDSTYKNDQYYWDFGDSTFYSGKNPPSHTYKAPGTYFPRLSVLFPTTGCFNKTPPAGNPVNLYARPVAKVSINKSACQDSLVNFKDNDYSFNSVLSDHFWDFGDTSGVVNTGIDTITHLYKYTGTYTIKYLTVTENGCRDSLTTSLIINPRPKASFSFTTPCGNSPTNFKDKSSVPSPGSIVSYSWDFGDGTTSTQQNPSHQYTTANTYHPKLIVTTANGCQDIDSLTLVINPLPLMRIVTTDVCKGITVFVGDSTHYPVDTAVSWTWDFGDKSAKVTTTSRITSHNYANSGTFRIRLSATTTSGCIFDTIDSVHVYELPVVNFSYAGGCSRKNVSFLDKSTVSGGAIGGEIWDFGDPNFDINNPNNGSGPSPTHRYDSSGSVDVKLVVITQAGSCADSLTKTLTILQTPDTNFTSTKACENSAVNFKFKGRVPAGQTYFWNFGDIRSGDTSTAKDPNYTYLKGGLYTAVVTVKSTNGCQASGSYFVAVNPKPVVTIDYDNVCVDSAVTFTGNTAFDTSLRVFPTITNYSWDFGDSTAVSNTPDPTITHTYKYTGSHTVTLTITTSDTCYNNGSRVIELNPLPLADFVTASGCNEFGLTFTDASSGNIVKYIWDYGDGIIDSPSKSNAPHIFQNNFLKQSVTLTVITDKGCRAERTHDANTYQAPTSDFTIDINSPYRACAGDTVPFSSASTQAIGDNVVSSYLWLFGDGATSTDTNTRHAYSVAGNYVVRLVSYSEHGCPDTTGIKNPNYFLSIIPLPKAAFGVGATTCVGVPVYFYDSTNYGKNFKQAYINWDFGDNTFPNTDPFPTFTFTKPGNYVISLRAKNSGGCYSDTARKTITIHPSPVADFSFFNTCEGAVTQFRDSSSVASPSTLDDSGYRWSFGDGAISSLKNPSNAYTSSGYYNVQLTVRSQPGSCSAIAKKLVFVQPRPIAKFFATPNPIGNDTPVVTFIDSSLGNNITTRFWSYGDGVDTLNPPLSYQHKYTPADPIDTGSYIVKLLISNKYGCADSTYQVIKVKQILKLDGRFPNAFTPNGDGLDDYWHPVTRGVFSYTCIIVDRWGQLVYKTDDWNTAGWDGTYLNSKEKVPEGVYVYYATFTDYDNQYIQKMKGSLLLIR